MAHWCLAFVVTYILLHPRARNARPKWHVCIYVWKQDASSVSQTGFYIIVLRRQSLQYFLYRALPNFLRARISNLDLN